ncbi:MULTISPECIES: Spo0E family sporulation regulatory protein-aspartic acid phosphatase [Brevibacillus]|uniref:Spo0E family sporulation regulatory protein-aspartic acid phosphatase n=1 Tax=Brevibacillus TaxID=55080 RepID=UPI0020C65BE4
MKKLDSLECIVVSPIDQLDVEPLSPKPRCMTLLEKNQEDLEKEMEDLRGQLIDLANVKGFSNIEVVELSQLLDEYIVQIQSMVQKRTK